MGFGKAGRRERPHTFMGRLRSDVSGNTIALMAAMLIPMTALAGSAIDMARLYVIKVRLQQACDAGVLAGRKFMSDTGTTLDSNATTQANTFFANNFNTGWMKTNTVSFTPSKTSDNQVAGTATATVPMTIMKMFGAADTVVTVACKARFDVADTDVIFVLDTTGSMSCLPADDDSTCSAYVNAAGNNSYVRPSGSGGVTGYAGSTAYSVPEKTNSRIEALRQAVLSFYDTFAANADPSTHIRYGFVTYTSSVNVGQAILDSNSAYLVGSNGSTDMPYYQSRHVYADYVSSTSDSANNGKTQTNCTAAAVRTPGTALTYNASTSTATKVYDVWTYNSGNSGTKVCKTRTDTLIPQWEYKKLQLDVSSLIAGNTIVDPTKVDGSMTKWLGCVETTTDTPGQTSFSAASPPSEIDPELKPSGAQRWWPHMQDLEYERNNSATDGSTDYSNGESSSNENYGSAARAKSGYVACGKPVKRLGVMTRDQVHDFVYATDFVPIGGTYHDTGMIWGGRLIAPNGGWAADTAAWPNRNAPNRVVVFMTDGDMAPTTNSYSMYGEEGYDRRVLGTAGTSNLTTYHNNRFLGACAAAKAKNIDIWTVAIDSSASTTLQSCATTTTQALYTTSGSGLATAFASIAQHLAMLRITQ